MSDLTVKSFEWHHKATDVFDYFVCGVAGAIFAYIVKDYAPHKLDWNLSVLTPIALLLLAFSFFAGLKRIEATVGCMRANSVIIDAVENASKLAKELVKPSSGEFFDSVRGTVETADSVEARRLDYLAKAQKAERSLERGKQRAARYYKLRNVFLYLGFATILAAKVAQPYVQGVSDVKTVSVPRAPTNQALSQGTSRPTGTNRAAFPITTPPRSNTATAQP